MTTYVFSYRMPEDFVLGQPETVAAWTAWFDGMGTSLADLGQPVVSATALGDCGAGTRLGGYSLITADDLEGALRLAKSCPSLEQGGGLEVGVLGEVPDRLQRA